MTSIFQWRYHGHKNWGQSCGFLYMYQISFLILAVLVLMNLEIHIVHLVNKVSYISMVSSFMLWCFTIIILRKTTLLYMLCVDIDLP